MPRGLLPAESYRERFAQGGFGQRHDLLCPFFADGGCRIWETRPSPCVRFVCQSSYGLAGQRVWAAAEALLRLTEETLAHDVLLRLGFQTDEIKSDEWFEFKPEMVAMRAGQIVASLSAAEVWDLLQPQGARLCEELGKAAGDALGSRS